MDKPVLTKLSSNKLQIQTSHSVIKKRVFSRGIYQF